MSTLDVILGIILLLAAVFLVAAVLMQQGKSKGMGAIGGGSSDTFFGKTKSKTWEKRLAKYTTIVGIVFVVIVLAVYVIDENSALIDNPVEETKAEETSSTPDETTAETSAETSAATTQG